VTALAPSTIRTDRLTLTPLAVDDADAMVDVLADERMYEYTGGRPPDLAALRERYQWLAAGRSPSGDELWFNWITRLAPDDTPVGVMQATVAVDGTTADVAWEIGVPWQGRGIASEAAAAVVDWLLDHDVAIVRAMIHAEHAASAAVAARAGLTATDELVDGEILWRRGREPV
jgi:RimJ/RimL family protein N-acetyltransferase